MKKHVFLIGLLLTFSIVGFAQNKIDRKSVVDRHKVLTKICNHVSPAQVGNGNFAFGVDITGLQTFIPHYTMSHWSWHSFPLAAGLNPDDFKGQIMDTHGRQVRYDIGNDEQPELSAWLAGNPHRFNLGRIGFILKKKDGTPVALTDLKKTVQEIDLWTGIITSKFELDGQPVRVTTVCNGVQDAIGVEVVSPLLNTGQIEIEFSFPYPDKSFETKNTYNQPDVHRSILHQTSGNAAKIERIMDDTRYNEYVNWETPATFSASSKPHFFRLISLTSKLKFTCSFSEGSPSLPSFSECVVSSKRGWKNFWMSGAAIDLSASKDTRWFELERRIILSQYLTKINESGSWPPQENGLVSNDWYGRFHFEMIWWHEVHYALWNRWNLMDKCMHIYSDFLPTSIERAKNQGYAGARWPKCTATFDRDWPAPIHATLIWQQPSPIYFAELDYRLHPTQATLDKWKDVVMTTADFMADYAFYESNNDRYVLGPPVYIMSENTDPKTTVNPTFELSYWRFGLRTAQKWRERLSLPRDSKWDNVLKKLSPLPIQDNVYVTCEGIQDMWTKYAWEHPGLIGTFGMLPGDGVDNATFVRTLDKVLSLWDFNRTWGWDFSMTAMACARSGNPEKAVDMLLHPSQRFQFNEFGLPASGRMLSANNCSLLAAVGMMTGGWDGSTGDAPGFPKNGKWVVKHEGFNRMP